MDDAELKRKILAHWAKTDAEGGPTAAGCKCIIEILKGRRNSKGRQERVVDPHLREGSVQEAIIIFTEAACVDSERDVASVDPCWLRRRKGAANLMRRQPA
jgi:hypothetical protein